MKKFQFSLDTVLDYKQQVLDGIQNEYSALLLQVRRQEERLHREQQNYIELNQEFRQATSQGITVAAALNYENGLRFFEKRIAEEERLLAECQKKAGEKRKQLVAARQDTSSLEKLKEKKKEAYVKLVQKMEEQFIDELVSASRLTTSKIS